MTLRKEPLKFVAAKRRPVIRKWTLQVTEQEFGDIIREGLGRRNIGDMPVGRIGVNGLRDGVLITIYEKLT